MTTTTLEIAWLDARPQLISDILDAMQTTPYPRDRHVAECPLIHDREERVDQEFILEDDIWSDSSHGEDLESWLFGHQVVAADLGDLRHWIGQAIKAIAALYSPDTDCVCGQTGFVDDEEEEE